MKPIVLIVEDEPAQMELLVYNLEKENFRLQTAEDGEEALLLVEENQPDLIILDWMLPEVSGIEVCRRLKKRKSLRHIPIIMVTARGEESDRVRGLDTGADDYIVKPYSPREMIARVHALLRRSRVDSSDHLLAFADLTLDTETYKVMRAGRQVHLGPTEFRLLKALLQKPGRVFSRENLLDRVWGHDAYLETRTVDVHIGRLRKALNVSGGRELIRTVRGAGYAIDG